jgi:hypothetical protein
MTALDVLGRADELTDGTGGSMDAVMGAAIGPYRKSRFMRILIAFPSIVVATAAAMFERSLQNAVDIKSENDLTV